MSRFAKRSRGVGRAGLVVAAVCVLAGGSCGVTSKLSRKSALHFACGPQVNEGVLLTIDVVLVNEVEAAQIRQVGDGWFSSPLRRQLELRTTTIAVRGGCDEKVEIAKQKGYEILAVIAEYASAGTGAAGGNMQFRTKKEWEGKKLEVSVQNAYLTISEKE